VCVCAVKVQSSRDFDGFLLTGLYTVTSSPTTSGDREPAAGDEQTVVRIPAEDERGVMAADTSNGFVCSIVHSHIGHRPRHQLQFVWKAPSSAIGCINFLLVTCNDQSLFTNLLENACINYGTKIKVIIAIKGIVRTSRKTNSQAKEYN